MKAVDLLVLLLLLQERLMGFTTLRFGQVLGKTLFDPRIANMLCGLATILPRLMCSKVLDVGLLNDLLLVVRQLHLDLGL